MTPEKILSVILLTIIGLSILSFAIVGIIMQYRINQRMKHLPYAREFKTSWGK
jgi:hypothetical protein